MAKCPSCKSEDCYFPFFGPPECVNSTCQFFNKKHFDSMKNEIESKKTDPKQLLVSSIKQERTKNLTEQITKDIAKLSSDDDGFLSYDQAVSASIARAKKP